MKQIEKVLAENIKARRAALGLSQQQLAERSDKARGTIAQIETGTMWPSPAVLDDLARALNVSPASLFKSPEVAVNEVVSTLTFSREITSKLFQDPKFVDAQLKLVPKEILELVKNLNFAAQNKGFPSELMDIISELIRVSLRLGEYVNGKSDASSGVRPDITWFSSLKQDQIDRLRRVLELEEEGKREAEAEMLAEEKALNRKNRKKR